MLDTQMHDNRSESRIPYPLFDPEQRRDVPVARGFGIRITTRVTDVILVKMLNPARYASELRYQVR